jgi:3-oxoacyl-[acyl-carrier-protein] synthase II
MAEFFHRVREERPLYRPDVTDVLRRREHIPAAMIARAGRCTGAMQVFSTACTASGHSIGEAYRQVQDGDADFVLAGGYDSLITWLDVLGFSLLGALTPHFADEPERASRPFSEDRSGFVLGEGSVIFALEERDQAQAREATILGEIVGYSSTMNAYRMTDPPPDGGAIITCMESALAEAGATAHDVGYIAAHGTSTPGNDLTETQAIRSVFQDAAPGVAISSVKSMVGHLTAAAAGLGMLGALGVLRHGAAPPTINLDHADPKLDLNYVANEAQPVSTDLAMVNAFAFGGTNTCIILKRGD